MGTTTEQARAQVAATRARVDSTLDRLELRIRQELSPRRRLRRDGAKLAVGVVVVALVGTTYLVRARRRRREEPGQVDWIDAMPEEWRSRLSDLLAEAAAGQGASPRLGSPKHPRSALQSLALRGGRMALPVVLNAVAERLANRQPSPGSG
ncbi:MAG: hypothetical protein ACYCS2_08800 [Acidimicrobiales bacterium]